MTSKINFIVRFFHRTGWEVFAEYGPTMRDVAIDKAYKLSDPFGDAEVRVVQVTSTMTSWQDGILLELITVKNTVLESHFERFPKNA